MVASPQPQSTEDRLARLEKALANLTSKTLFSANVGAGGLTIDSGGSIRMLGPTGQILLFIGPDGSGHQVIQLWRPDGTLVLATAVDSGTGREFWALWDRLGHTIVADDVQSTTGGLARPYLDYPLYPARVADYRATTNAAFESLWSADVEIQHPVLGISISITDSGASGNVRILADGVSIGSTSYTAGSPTSWQPRITHGLSMNVQHFLEIQAQRTSGAGTLAVSPVHFRGEQT